MLSIDDSGSARTMPPLKVCAAAILIATALAACSPSTEEAPGTAAVAPGNFDFEGWDQYLGGADSSQYSSLKQIDKSNVGQLEVAWTYPTTENYLFNPLIVGNTMYVLAKGRSIVALDAASGRELWAHANEGAVGTRGMNYWRSPDGTDERLLYINAGHLTAINAKTGETIRTFGSDGRVDLRLGFEGDISRVRGQTNNPGRIFEDTIIMSLPAGGGGYASAPADIHAYDVRTGAPRWIFHTVPRPGEFGADTWPEGGLGNYGGVHNWSESTVDSELGIVYIPTGTARYDFYGGNRHGENLFGNSLVALDARSG
jgi:quinoprotein glucose dehydrogenase